MHSLGTRHPGRRCVAVLVCVMLAGCGGFSRRGPLNSDLAAYVPADAMVLAGVNLEQLRTAPLYRELARRNRLPNFGQFQGDPNFDPKRDLREVLLAWDGRHALAIARGSFPNPPPSGVTMAGQDIGLAGPAAVVEAAIRQHKNRNGGPRDLLARAEALPTGVQIWVVAAGWRGLDPGDVRALGNLGNIDRVLRLASDASLSIDLRNGVHAAFTSDSVTDRDAQSLADSLRGLATLARIEGIAVAQNARRVNVTIDIPEEQAEKLLK